MEQTHEETHAQPRYMLVWGVLALLMLAKVGISYLNLPQTTSIVLLVFIALWKAALVAMYYMHLRFEPRRLIVLALVPLPLAAILVLVVLTEF